MKKIITAVMVLAGIWFAANYTVKVEISANQAQADCGEENTCN